MTLMYSHEDPDFQRTRLQVLIVEHRDLDEAIAGLTAAPGKDDLLLRRLKKRKLILKDRIALLECQLEPDAPA